MAGLFILHEVTTGRNRICNMRLQWSDPICSMKLTMVGPYIKHEVTNGWDSVCYMRLRMVVVVITPPFLGMEVRHERQFRFMPSN